ncbi:ankyrin-3-like [Trichogramma pretiosum]|uniref:ankyrin-3-like n=1 Tax=Trichogramma pretiosum TaxID=7493 RepID=UPI0006C9D7C3|nr:ankyrin-3-like [Trichogramma pretiosum]
MAQLTSIDRLGEIMNQFKKNIIVEVIRTLREHVNWQVETQRYALLDRIFPFVSDWQGPPPNLRDIFRPEEIDRLLLDAVDYWGLNPSDEKAVTFVGFVFNSGYRDELDGQLDEAGRPTLRRTTALHRAARRRLIRKVSREDSLIKWLFGIYNRFDLNYVDESGLSHFHVACLTDSTLVVNTFLEHDHDPNVCWPENDDSPLHLALGTWDDRSINREMVELLLITGADPNAANKQGIRPLLLCVGHRTRGPDFLQSMFRFSQRTVEIDAPDESGDTALHWALRCGHGTVAKFLLRKGANPNVSNKRGLTPLHVISEVDDTGHLTETFFVTCDQLGREVDIDAHDKFSRSPLNLAVANIRPDVVERLLCRGAELKNFVFPKSGNFGYSQGKILEQEKSETQHDFRLRITAGVMAIVEHLKAEGFQLEKAHVETIKTLVDKYQLYDSSARRDRLWYRQESFAKVAKKISLHRDTTLYGLLKLDSKRAAERLRFAHLYKLACLKTFCKLLDEHKEAFIAHLWKKIFPKMWESESKDQ